MNTYIYIHVCCVNNWKEIFSNLLSNISKSGLYNKIKAIKCFILKENKEDLEIFNDEKIEILGISDNLKLYEQVTLNFLYTHSLIEDFNVLYIHTKGVKHNNTNINVTDWVNYLIYFNILKHNVCINKLLDYDTVGVNLQKKPELHYSGNFWWARSTYIRKLDKCKYENYHSPEFWITEKKIGKYLSLWSSGVDHYNRRYEEHNFIDKMLKYEFVQGL